MLDSSFALEMQDRLNFTNENAKLVMSEIEYKRQLYEYHNRTRVKGSYEGRFGFYDEKHYNNHLKDIKDYVVNDLVISGLKTDSLYIRESKIGKYFSKNSVQEIVSHLEEN